MKDIPRDQLYSVTFKLADLLSGSKYAIRGTASLVLQGYDMKVEDIDIICDEGTALAINYILRDYLVKEVSYSESAKYKSYFGQFLIENVKVEVMGEFQIKTEKGTWGEPFDGSESSVLEIEGHSVCVTTVESELKMFAYMGRWNAFHKIKSQIKGEKKEADPAQPALF